MIWDEHLPEQDRRVLENFIIEICTSEGLSECFVAHTLKLILRLKEPSIRASGIDVTWCFWTYVTSPKPHSTT